MPLDETTEAELLAYAYGELSAPAARAFEERLQGDVELQAELAGMRATRELFGRDARWGLDAKIDLPPPHLVDAMVRAEALARPGAIRDARAIAPRPTLTARLSRWLVGGGVLVGATAALFIMVRQGGADAVLAPMPASAESAPEPPADLPAAAADARAPAGALAKNEAAISDGALEGADGKLRARDPEQLPDAFKALAHTDAKPRPAEEVSDDERGRARELTTEDRGGAAIGLATGHGGLGGRSGGTTAAKDAPAAEGARTSSTAGALGVTGGKADEAAGEKKAQGSFGGGYDPLDFDSVTRAPRPDSVATPAAAPPPPAKPADASKPSASPRRTNAPSTPPSDAPALVERPSASALGMVTRDEAKAERRRFGDLRAEQSEKRKKETKEREPAREPAAKTAEAERQAKAPTPSTKPDAAKQDDAKKAADKAPTPVSGPEQKRAMQSELALMSGYRELKEGRALGALDEFQSAERLDARRALGSDPHVGQMRALLALKRPAEALTVARRLVTRDLAEPGVTDGILLGAKIAEELGDLRSARELWTALVKAPAHKAAALTALARLANPAVRAQVETDEAAAEAPAAAAPATQE